ncbi:hypothetical protein BKA64DRAFT_544215, partial [Cadophora sp. MPI-SDFR-AT-0126]
SSLPIEYSFLQSPPISSRKNLVNFRHPTYPPENSLLFSLYVWDHADGGIDHGLAHNACAIIADNHFEGYLSRTCNGEPITAPWDDVLPADHDYYFHVPWPGG